MKSKQSGFTLVEIAIVLVIVGLLLGGVLKGQELITSGKAKALYADQSAIQTAYNTYNDRFRAIPGDDSSASTRFSGLACGQAGASGSTVAGVCGNGNGNGTITGVGTEGGTSVTVAVAPPAANPATGAAGVGDQAGENYKFWQHLRAAQLIKTEGSQTNTVGGANAIYAQPLNPTSGRTAISTTRSYFGQQDSLMYFLQSNVPGNVATALDAANDDGFTNRGGLRAANNGTLASPNTAVTGAPYVNATTYTISTNLL